MSPEELRRHFDVLAEAPNGVQKLRELILQLGIRGKLVPQNPGDEPAGVLLERIATARKRTRGDRNGTAKPVEFLPCDQAPYAIPDSWCWTRLSSVGEIVGGGTPKTDAPAYWTTEGGVPWLTPADLNGLEGKYAYQGRRQISQAGLAHSAAQLLPAGAVLFSSRAPIGYVAIAGAPLTTNQGFKSCVPYLDGMSDYIFRFLQAVGPEVDRNAPGTTFKEVSGKIVGQIAMPLPPLAEQQRIAARVEELMALCDRFEERQQRRAEVRGRLNRSALHLLTAAPTHAECAAHWQRVRDSFDRLYDSRDTVAELRQAVLQLAVQGKLMPQDPGDEPAPVLLARMAAERERLVRQGKIGTRRPLPPVSDGERAFAAPHGWTWTRFGEVITSIEAGWSPNCEPRPRHSDEWGVLKISAVSWGAFDPDENKALPAHLEARPEYEVKAGDFLMSRANTADLVGRSVVVMQTPPHLLLNDKTLRVHVPEQMDRQYLNLFNNCGVARSYYAEQASGTSSSMRNLSREQIQRLPIAIPPLNEQRRIVAKVGELMRLCDALEARLTRASETSAHLAASMVYHVAAA